MKSDINLISQSQVEKAEGGKSLRVLKLIAIASVSIAGISSLIIFLIIQGISPSGIKKQEDSLRVSLANSRVKEAKILLINRKLKDIRQIINNRENYDSLLLSLNSSIPEGILISELEVNKESIKIIASSNSLLSINQLLDNLLSLVEKKELIKNLNISGISSSGESSSGYSVSLTAQRYEE